MKVLVVCSFRNFRPDGINAYIKEQVASLNREGVETEYYLVRGKGIIGYVREIPKLRKVITLLQPNVIHAHYGLCGLLANIATRRIPVVTTYHGSDINDVDSRRFSIWAIRMSAWNIFVSRHTRDIVHKEVRENSSLIACGVDLTKDQLKTRKEARKKMGWKDTDKKVLFAGMFEDVKGPKLAFDGMNALKRKGIKAELIELKGYTREEVNRLMCAVDCLLMTSKSEGSPQVIKEALACGCPIVSTNVGDVYERVVGVEGCFVVDSRDPQKLAEAMTKAFKKKDKTSGRAKIIADGMDNKEIASKLLQIYKQVKK